MSNPVKQQQTLRVTGIDKMCLGKQERDKYTYRINKHGEGSYIVNDVPISVSNFHLMFPIELQTISRPQLDGRKI
jgi:hypothetical protein